MATDVQKRVIKWLAAAGGEIVIITGFKQTDLRSLKSTGAPCIITSSNVVDGLRNNNFVEKAKADEYGRAITYRLAAAGRAQAEKL